MDNQLFGVFLKGGGHSYFESIPTECYIKPQNYERSKTKKFKSNMALRENMAYDPELDEYTCQAGKRFGQLNMIPVACAIR